MKRTAVIIALLAAGTIFAFGQSRSFQALEHKFSANEDVYSFSTSGFFARTVLWLAGEHEFKKSIKQIKKIHVITIPKSAFSGNDVSVRGFKKVVRGESFEELAVIRDQGDEVSIYFQRLKNSSINRYLILIDNPEELVAVEIKGYIDVNLLNNQDRNLSYKH